MANFEDKLILSYYMGDEHPVVVCPVCRFENVHIEAPEFISSDDYKSDWVRGDVITLPMSCENGHVWNMEFGFHKGNTFFRVIRKSDRADLM